MIRQLADDQKTVADAARDVIAAADEAGDQATADLATRRVEVHEKNAWMLSSHLE
jgi:starvation-inducible DNA-binding protein